MNKHLVHSEEEYIALFDEYDLNDAEVFLRVEFAFVDGTYVDLVNGNDDQEVDRKTFRKNEESVFPDSYPCLVLLANEKSFDRIGNTTFKFLDFVYLSDFILSA